MLCVLDHLLHFIIRQGGRASDADGLLLTGALILSGYAQNTVGIDIEGHLNLGHATLGRGDAIQAESSQALVVIRHFPLTLQDVDFHVGLAIGSGGEHLRLLGGNGGVPGNDFGHNAPQGFHTQGQRGHIQQQDVLDFPSQDATLDGSTDRNHFIGVNALVGLLIQNLLHHLFNGGNPGGTTNQDDLVDVGLAQLGIPQGILNGDAATVNQLRSQLFKLGPGQGDIQVLGTVLGSGNEGQVNVRLGHAGQLNLGFLRSLGQTLQGLLILTQVDALSVLEFARQEVHDDLVEVVSTEVGVTGGCQYFKYAVAHFQDGDVEGTAP